MPAGLNYLNGVDTYTEDNYTEADYAMSNIGGDGGIVPLYSNIKLTKKFGVEDALNFFKVEPIGKTNNVETHLFQVSSTGELDTAIVEWTAFDDDVYNGLRPVLSAADHRHGRCLQVLSREGRPLGRAAPPRASGTRTRRADTTPTRRTGPSPSTAHGMPCRTC